MKGNRKMKLIGLFVAIWVFLLATYGGVQLWDRASRLEQIEARKTRIANLETKITFLENNDWALAIQQLPPIVQDELAALNKGIKQKKNRKYERYEQPLLTEKERRRGK